MKLLFLLLFCISILYAKSDDTCYSVQLTSFKFKKNSTYDFAAHNYPKTCRLISFSNINSVRCGCYEKYRDARAALKKLSKKYPKPIIVNTYKYRFQKKVEKVEKLQKNYKKITKKPQKKNIPKISPVLHEPLRVSEEVTQKETASFLDDISYQGNINLTLQSYMKAPAGKEKQNALLSANFEAKYIKENFTGFAKARVQQDYYDLQKTAKHTNRSFIRLDELYGSYDFENDSILLGKNILFWGALEVRNIVNVFNPDELRSDPFYTDKLGVINAAYTHYTESGEFSAIIKLYEQNRKMPAYPYVYYYFPATLNVAPNVTLPLVYKEKLKTKASPYRPSIYLKYSDSTDTQYALDYAFVFENGYDSQRYYTQTLQADNTVTTEENAYLVNKFMTYDTLVIGATLYKLEATFADILDDTLVSDYIHVGIGAEHTLSQVYKEADLGLLVEYYRYITLQSGKKDDLALFELFQNDLFLGLRYSFNQGNDASIVGGGILDLDYNEQVYYMEYQTRVMDTFKLNFDYRYISPSKNYNTAFKLMGAHERISLKLGYYF
ncbi:hypothetical protein MLC35_04390 [Sulfurimonas sp. NW7]|uniref:hypothetical protein n=1 Tax=Sulfurimonas sp. NW7 TaxID=2922727 RepID=UPI003DA8BB87